MWTDRTDQDGQDGHARAQSEILGYKIVQDFHSVKSVNFSGSRNFFCPCNSSAGSGLLRSRLCWVRVSFQCFVFRACAVFVVRSPRSSLPQSAGGYFLTY